MLTMAQVNCIREMFFEKGMSYAEIARATGHDVKTVKKYIYMDNFNAPPPEPARKHGSKLDRFKPEIDSWLEADKQERKKQRHTALQVFKRLCKIYGPGFDCSYRLVAQYVAEKKKELYSQQSQFYMPLVHIPGEAQVDFGEADFFENNKRHTGHYLNLSFPCSNGGYMQLFKGENLQCLAEGLTNIFSHIGGVPTRIWFDNPPTVVKKILKNGERELTDDFLRLMNHYGFAAAFCNAGCGNEKGHVENKVGYHRRNLLVPVPEIDDLRAFNRHLLVMCDQDMQRSHYLKGEFISELFEGDRKALLPLPRVAYDCSKLKRVRTNSYAKFTLNGGKHIYSTAPQFANSDLLVKLTAYEVVVLDESYWEITAHPRLYGEEIAESMDWLPYLTQLSRRPAALKYTGIYPLLPDPVQEFLSACDYQAKKEALRVLARLTEESSFEQATGALVAALEHGACDADSIRAMFSRLNNGYPSLDPLALQASVPEVPPSRVNVGEYDRLFLQGGGPREN
jgi:transposase